MPVEASAQLAVLRANSEAYERTLQAVSSADFVHAPNETLDKVARSAVIAERFHPGRFADGAIENVALAIGKNLSSTAASPRRPRATRTILHVATRVHGIGGHARTLKYWAAYDLRSTHVLALTDQRGAPIPQWISNAFRARGNCIVVLDGSLCERAAALRELAHEQADLVVVHHDGCDVVPTVALATGDCPPVAVLNHLDHIFWLGSSVADATINLRSYAAQHSADRRSIGVNLVLPIPLGEPASNIARSAARRLLGIPNDQTVLLSIGRGLKYRPCGRFDFVATVNSILCADSNVHMYVVGESREGIAPHLNVEPHERLHFCGVVEDPTVYRAAADIYVESFPFGSNTALLEAALEGLPVVPGCAPLSPLLASGNDSLSSLLSAPVDEEQFIEQVRFLIHQGSERKKIGDELRAAVLASHVGGSWTASLELIYEKLLGLQHAPREIPRTRCEETEDDVGLGYWGMLSGARQIYGGLAQGGRAIPLRHEAFALKAVGDYSGARRAALRALVASPCSLASWRLLLACVLGRIGPSLRQHLPRAVTAHST